MKENFFQILWGNAPPEGTLVLWTLPDKASYFIKTEDIKTASEKVNELAENHDVYFGVGLQNEFVNLLGTGKRGTAEDVIALPGFWMDIDILSEGHHKSDKLPDSVDSALAFLNDLPLQPTLIVHTGGGLHAYWLFKTPYMINTDEDRATMQTLSRQFQDYIIHEASKRKWQLDNTSDLARVLRVPDTWNRKNPSDPKLVKIITHHVESKFRYDVEAFRKYKAPASVESWKNKVAGNVIPFREKISEGERNNTLTSIAGSLHRRGLSVEAIQSALITENNVRCSPPLPENEVRGIAQSVSRYPTSNITQPTQSPQGIQFKLTDMGNAERFISRWSDSVRYCEDWRAWLLWDGKRWVPDKMLNVENLAKLTIRSIYGEAETISNDAERKNIVAHAVKSESMHAIRAMLELSKSDTRIAVNAGDFDKDDFLLNVANGTVCLKTGTINPHDRKHLITKLIDVPYDPLEVSPLWLSFLDRIMDKNADLINFLQRAVGYALTGDITEQVIFILYGTGANGKSTLLETIREIMGDYAKQTDFTTFLMKQNTNVRNDLAALKGARMVTSSETEAGRRLSEVTVKQITGGEPISSRFLRCEFFEYKPKFKIFLATNHRPRIVGTDNGIWRRIRLIPFSITIPDKEIDRKLPEKLQMELPGILSWLIEGSKKWFTNQLGYPDKVRTATDDYRESMDNLGDFIEAECVLGDNLKTSVTALYEKYKVWADLNSESMLGKKQFGIQIGERGFQQHRGKERMWLGIGIKTTESDDMKMDMF